MAASLLLASTNPVGEKAHYIIDKDPKRTSSLIKSGVIDTQVTQFLAETDPPAYEVEIRYNFKISFLGVQQGVEKSNIDDAYFDRGFLIELRKSGHYEGEKFKADHLGYADARNLDGKLYPNCDKVKLYDIVPNSPTYRVLATLLTGGARADIKNLVVIVHIYEEIPVLGGAKVDVSGVYNGMKVKGGGDFIP